MAPFKTPFNLSEVNYSMPGIKPLELNANTSGLAVGQGFALGTEPQLAGRYAGLAEEATTTKKKSPIDKTKETIEAMGIDPNSSMGSLFAMNLLQKYEEQDSDKFKEEAEYFFDLMQRNADRAQQRGERSTLIAGLVDLPNKIQQAQDRQYAFFPEQLEAIRASISRPQFFGNAGISQYLK
jgi:hypothetical protein